MKIAELIPNLTMILGLSLVGPLAQASAPLSTVAIPAAHRIHLGAFEVTALSDGTVDLPMSKLLMHLTPAEYKQTLAKHAVTDPFETSINAFLINTGTKLILVDAGAGTLFGPTVGKVVSNLKVAGYKPEQVDMVLITHMHVDHVGGLSADGKMIFPNATIYADQKESDYWLSEKNAAAAPESAKSFFTGAMASLKPYQAAGKLKPLPAGGEIVEGIHSDSNYGHTPGHTTYVVESQSAKLVLLGDLVHVAAVQFDKPSVTIQFDTDAKEAEAKRKAAFTKAAKEGYLIGAVHLPFPALGHILRDKSAFAYVPLNYTR